MNIFYPLQLLADWLTYKVFAIVPATRLADALNFFIYDSLKIFILLAVIVFAVSLLRTYLPPEKTRLLLARKGHYTGNILAVLVGIATPFCTCSAIPLFLGFVQAGVPLGVTFSFLVASPMINEVAIVLLLGMFGLKVTALYIGTGLVIAVLSGIVIGRMNPEKLIEPFVFEKSGMKFAQLPGMVFAERISYARAYMLDIINKVWIYILVGIGVGAWMHGYVPKEFLAGLVGGHSALAVPLAVLIGIPLYSNAAGTIPLVGVLVEKGVSMGTALAFMMSVTALSLPEFLILKKVMKTRLILIFAGIVGLGITLTGYLFNAVLR